MLHALMDELNKRIRMSKTSKDQRKKSVKIRRREQVRWLSTITSILVLVIAVWLFWESSSENHDLSLIGQGTNVVVQIHDPGWGSCRELKRVGNSLEPEFKDRVTFLVANLATQEGRIFAEMNNSDKVTLLFFKPDGSRIHKLTGVQDADFLRKVFTRVFKLGG